MTTYFTSDTHFNHANIIGYCNRPFRDVGHMNRELVARWNDVVKPEDEVWHLGDYALGDQDVDGVIFAKLNGKKRLVRGNHDGSKAVKLAWAEILPFHYLQLEEADPLKWLLIHNPANLKQKHKGESIVLHGHLHGQMDLHPFEKVPGARYIDVGVDCWDYRPVTLEQLLSK